MRHAGFPSLLWAPVAPALHLAGQVDGEAPPPALPPERLSADVRRRRDLPGASLPLERGQPDPALLDAVHRGRGDALHLQGEGVRVPRDPALAREGAARLRGDGRARDRVYVL